MNKRTKNTDALLAHFAAMRAKAEAEPAGAIRDVSIKSARAAEWHTLFAALLVDAMRTIYDGDRVAARLDAIRAEDAARCAAATTKRAA